MVKEHKSPLVQEDRRWELPRVRTSNVLINLGLKPLRLEQMVKGGRKSTVRGAPYEGTSIAAVYGTDCSLV